MADTAQVMELFSAPELKQTVKKILLLWDTSLTIAVSETINCDIACCELICSAKKCVIKIRELQWENDLYAWVTFQGQPIHLDMDDTEEIDGELQSDLTVEIEHWACLNFARITFQDQIHYLPIITTDILELVLEKRQVIFTWHKYIVDVMATLWQKEWGENIWIAQKKKLALKSEAGAPGGAQQ